MILPRPSADYDRRDQAAVREALMRVDGENLKRGKAVEALLLAAPGGAVFALSVDDTGALVVTPR